MVTGDARHSDGSNHRNPTPRPEMELGHFLVHLVTAVHPNSNTRIGSSKIIKIMVYVFFWNSQIAHLFFF